MEYTKDLILQVNYGQGVKKENKVWGKIEAILHKIAKHKVATTVISVTLMLMILDFMLVSSFIQILSSM